MLQTLPAKVEVDLAMRADFVEIEAEIKKVERKIQGEEDDESQSARIRRDELYRQKVLWISEELKKWQKMQRHNIKVDPDGVAVASLSSYFKRIRRLDSRRDWLATSLFLEEPLRSVEGRRALEDMIRLCKENPPPRAGWHIVPACAQTMGVVQVVATEWKGKYILSLPSFI
jgi:hypothetical protein